MKKLKKKLVILGIAIALDVCLVISVTYAWLSNVNRVSSMSFDILQIDSVVNLYEANDFDYNGVPDKLATDNRSKYYNPINSSYIEYPNIYYTEEYSFNFIEQKYAISAESSVNTFSTVTLEDVLPSKIYTYKFEFINYAGIEDYITFAFDSDSTVSASILSNFEVRLCALRRNTAVYLHSDNNLYYDFSEWTDFVTDGTFNGITVDPYANDEDTDLILPKLNGISPIGRTDLWLQIRQKADSTATIDSFKFPDYRITLSTTKDE